MFERVEILFAPRFFVVMCLVWWSACASASERDDVGVVRDALQCTRNWPLPPPPLRAATGKTVVYLAETLLNGGILSVGEGVKEAVKAIGWNLRVIDARGNVQNRAEAYRKILALKPDGLILGGFNAADDAKDLEAIAKSGTVIVGWHAAPGPGAIPGTPVKVNVTSHPLTVARTAASYVAANAGDAAGIVIFTDHRYAIATAKSKNMEKVIAKCATCTLLAVEDVPLDRAAEIMPSLVRSLLAKYGKKWTHSLAINDLYFDAAAPALAIAGISPDHGITNISAGDGSISAHERIQANSYQSGTIPEPLALHGWQLIDELNRAFSGAPPSGYRVPVRLVLHGNADQDSGRKGFFDPENGYRETYRAGWRGQSTDKSGKTAKP